MVEKNTAVVISGYAGAGKDTVAQYISDQMEKNRGKYLMRLSLGDGVRDVAQQLFGFDHGEMDEYFYNYENKNGTVPGCKYSCREMLQIIGNEMRNLFHDEVWCDRVLKQSNEYDHDGIVVPDNRYPNELEFFKKHFNVVSIRVNRANATGNVGIKNHVSESHIMKTDFTLDNPECENTEGPYPELYKQIDELIMPLL
jgi:hypothetical protein